MPESLYFGLRTPTPVVGYVSL